MVYIIKEKADECIAIKGIMELSKGDLLGYNEVTGYVVWSRGMVNFRVKGDDKFSFGCNVRGHAFFPQLLKFLSVITGHSFEQLEGNSTYPYLYKVL